VSGPLLPLSLGESSSTPPYAADIIAASRLSLYTPTSVALRGQPCLRPSRTWKQDKTDPAVRTAIGMSA
jgi:hypothetical protein